MLNFNQEDLLIKPYLPDGKFELFSVYLDCKNKEKGYRVVLDIVVDEKESGLETGGLSDFVLVVEVDGEKNKTYRIGHDRAYHKYNFPCSYCKKKNQKICDYFDAEKVYEFLTESSKELRELLEDEARHLRECEERWEKVMKR